MSANDDNDNLFGEDFDLGDLDPRSFGSLFSDDGVEGSDATSLAPEDLIELDEGDEPHYSPSFGSLADDVDEGIGRPLIAGPSAFDAPERPEATYELADDEPFETVTPTHLASPVQSAYSTEPEFYEYGADEDEADTAAPFAPAPAPEPEFYEYGEDESDDYVDEGLLPGSAAPISATPYHESAAEVEPEPEASAAAAEPDMSGLSWRQRIAMARGKAVEPAAAPEPESAPEPMPETEQPQEVPQLAMDAKPRKLTMRQRMAIARGEENDAPIPTQSAPEPTATSDFAPESGSGDFATPPAPESAPVAAAAPRKLSLRDRINIAKGGEELTASDEDTGLIEIADGSEIPAAPKLAGGLRGLKDFWQERKAYAQGHAPGAPDPAFAGVNLSGLPSRKQMQWSAEADNRQTAKMPAAGSPGSVSSFAQLLTPLAGLELQMLQRELEAEEPVFMSFERARTRAANRNQIAFFVGLLVIALFAFKVGSGYLTNMLPHVPQPHWFPKSIRGNSTTAGVLFGLGLVVPFVTITVVADAVNYIWKGIAEGPLADIALGAAAVIFAAVIFVLLKGNDVASATIALVIWFLVRGVARRLLSALSRSSRRGGGF